MTHFSIQLLDSALHRREDFDCGVDALNRYLREKAGQDMRRMASGCWVLVDLAEPAVILGYYTLSPEGIEARELPIARRYSDPKRSPGAISRKTTAALSRASPPRQIA